MEGDFDLCELATEIPEDVLPIFDMFGMPKKCPVQNVSENQVTICFIFLLCIL